MSMTTQPELWPPPDTDWRELFGPGDPCQCGCGEREHRPAPKGRKDCLYGGRHPETPCVRFVPA